MEAENSGILVYLEGGSGNFAEETRSHLRDVGALELAGLLDELAARFRERFTPLRDVSRNKVDWPAPGGPGTRYFTLRSLGEDRKALDW